MAKRGKKNRLAAPGRFAPSSWPTFVGARSVEELAAAKQVAEREAKSQGATIEWVSHTARGDVRRRK